MMEERSPLHISLLQLDLVWQNKEANFKQIEQQLLQLPQPTDVVVLPEMFTTGFTMDPMPYAEPMDGPTASWLKTWAKKCNVHCIGSYIVSDKDQVFNRLVVTDPSGNQMFYDKRHLFRFGDEHLHYKGGNEKITVTINGWKIMPLICYDLRFPVWSRNSFEDPYDVLLYVANWPKPRAEVWKTLLAARAMENVCYVAGVNRVGVDGRELEYSGDSRILDFKGNLLCDGVNGATLLHFRLDYDSLKDFRKKFNTLLDGDKFQIIL